MGKFIVSQTYCFHELVLWCVEEYLPKKKVVVSTNGSILFCVNAESITKLLSLSQTFECQTLNEEALFVISKGSSQDEKVILLQSYTDKDVVIPKTHLYKSNIFPEISRQAISMMCMILGYDHDRTIDQTILGFMSIICSPTRMCTTKFHYAQFVANIIHFQLIEFHASISFRY